MIFLSLSLLISLLISCPFKIYSQFEPFNNALELNIGSTNLLKVDLGFSTYDKNDLCFNSLNETRDYCVTCNTERIENGSFKETLKTENYGTPWVGFTVDYKKEGVSQESVFIHPAGQRFTSSSAARASIMDGNQFWTKMKTGFKYPAPYSECEHPDFERRKQIDFFAMQYDYDFENCFWTCYQVFQMRSDRSCNQNIPCNPFNITNIFGFDIPQGITDR